MTQPTRDSERPDSAGAPFPDGHAEDDPAVILHQNLDEKVYERIRTMIADGVLAPGQRVAQEALATKLGVSRTPLVNALKRLAQEGLLRAIPRRGFRVRELSATELVQLLELRERLEPLAAELAATRITTDEADRMASEWREMATLPDTPASHQLYVARDRAFHGRLAELSGNPFLRAAMNPIGMLAAAYLHGTPRPWEDTVPDHLAVIAALRKGDPAASGEAMRRHIAPSLAALRNAAPSDGRNDVHSPGNPQGGPPNHFGEHSGGQSPDNPAAPRNESPEAA